MTTDLRSTAHGYIDRGWAVLLLKTDGSGGKIPPRNCTKCSWKLPNGEQNPEFDRHSGESCDHLLCHGFYAATKDKSRFDQMLTALPEGHLAIRTGQASRILVIDAEATSKGDDPTGIEVLENWANWAQVDWDLPPTLRSRSVSGGLHLYYRIPAGVEIISGRILPNIDIKSEAGYVGTPGPSTARTWIDGTELVDAPEELLEWLRGVKRMAVGSGGGSGGGSGKPDGYNFVDFLAKGCPGGHRDYFFNDLAFRVRKRGAPYGDYVDEIRAAWEKAAQPPDTDYYMPWEHVEYKLDRVWALIVPDPPTPGLAWAKKIEEEHAKRLATAHASDAVAAGLIISGSDGAPPVSPLEVGSLRYGEDKWYGTHDDDTAQRMLDVWGDWFRAIPKAKGGYAWIYYDGVTWQLDNRDQIWNAMGHLVALLPRELEYWERRCAELAADNVIDWRTEQVGGNGQNAEEFRIIVALRKYVNAMKDVPKKETGLKTFARLPEITISEEDLDSETRFIGLSDGRVLDIQAVHTGASRDQWIRPAEPEMLLTRTLGCGYVAPSNDVPGTLYEFSHFKRYLEGVLPLAKVRDTVQEIVGYSLLGQPEEKIIVLLHGPSDSGKTVLLEILEAMFGGYGGWADSSALIAGKAKSAHSEWLHKLRGMRIIVTPETAKGAKIDAAWMKSYTGREVQSSRGAYGDKTVDWRPNGIIFNASNHYLEYDAEDTAVAERTQVIEFEERFLRGDPRRDDQLPHKIRASELPIILNWALAGLVRHGARVNDKGARNPRLVIADKIVEWSKRYRVAQDHIGQFILDAQAAGYLVKADPKDVAGMPASGFVTCKIVYELYKAWCGEEMRKPVGRNTFNKHLKAVYEFKDADSGGKRWIGYTSGIVDSVFLVQW